MEHLSVGPQDSERERLLVDHELREAEGASSKRRACSRDRPQLASATPSDDEIDAPVGGSWRVVLEVVIVDSNVEIDLAVSHDLP